MGVALTGDGKGLVPGSMYCTVRALDIASGRAIGHDVYVAHVESDAAGFASCVVRLLRAWKIVGCDKWRVRDGVNSL